MEERSRRRPGHECDARQTGRTVSQIIEDNSLRIMLVAVGIFGTVLSLNCGHLDENVLYVGIFSAFYLGAGIAWGAGR